MLTRASLTGGLSGMFRKKLLWRALLKASRSSIVVIFAGRVFHRRGPNTTNDDSYYRVKCFHLQFLGSDGTLVAIPWIVSWN